MVRSGLTLKGMTSFVTRKRSRWKSDTMSRKTAELHWDKYVAKLWKSCHRQRQKTKKQHTVIRSESNSNFFNNAEKSQCKDLLVSPRGCPCSQWGIVVTRRRCTEGPLGTWLLSVFQQSNYSIQRSTVDYLFKVDNKEDV